MGIKDVIETVKRPATLFFDGEYYDSVDELLAACNITRADYTQVKATHRDWDAMNVVDFLVKSNKGVLPSKNPQYKPKSAAESNEPVINVLDIPAEEKKEAEPAKVEEVKADEKVEEAKAEEVKAEEEKPEDAKADDKADEKPEDEKADEVKADDAKTDDKADDKADEAKADKADEEAKVEEKVEETKDVKDEPVVETAEDKTKEEVPMNEYDYTQAADAAKAPKAAPAPSGSTAKAFDELLANLNIAKEGYLVVKQVESSMSDLDIVNAILTTKGNPVGETSKDFDELLNNLNTPKIGFQLVKQIHNDWSDLDVINAIIKSR